MIEFKIKSIPEHIAYTVEYDTAGEYDFYDFETGGNLLQDLENLVLSENPGVVVPKIPNDYNYFTYPAGVVPRGNTHISYYDMVNKKGNDNTEGKYRFVVVPAVKAVILEHHGAFSKIPDSIEKIFEWIDCHGLKICGETRVSAIHGPWDTELEANYLMEIQVPVL